MEYLVEQRRIVEDSLIFEIPFSRLLTMNGGANPVTLIEPQGLTEAVIIDRMTWVPIPSNEIALTESAAGACKISYNADSADGAKAFEAIGLGDPFTHMFMRNDVPPTFSDQVDAANMKNKGVYFFYDGTIEDNGAEGKMRIIIDYRILELS